MLRKMVAIGLIASLAPLGVHGAAAQDDGHNDAAGSEVRAGTSGAVIGLQQMPTTLLKDVDNVSAGEGFFITLKDGQPRMWSAESPLREIGVFPRLTNVSRIDVGTDRWVAVEAGRVYAFRSNRGTSVPDEVQSGVSAARVGGRHTLALKDGRVIAWGSNSCGQRSVPAAARSGVDQIRAGGEHSLALKDGAVIAWGCISTVPAALRSGVTAISAGTAFNLALKNGRVFAWDDSGLLTVPRELRSGVTTISAGHEHSFARKNGRLISWGRDSAGETVIPRDALAAPDASAGFGFSVALTDTGRVLYWGLGSSTPESVPEAAATGVSRVAVGSLFSVALKAGKVIVWGDGTAGVRRVPAAATAGVDEIAASRAAVITLEDGRVDGWGTGYTSAPPETTSGVTAIAAGDDHFLALKNGGVIAWGRSDEGQTSVPPSATSGIAKISAGGNMSIAITTTGNVIAWGTNGYDYEQVMPPAASTNVRSIATDGEYWIAQVGRKAIVWQSNFVPNRVPRVTEPTIFRTGVTAVSVLGDGSFIVAKDGSAINWSLSDGVRPVPQAAQRNVIAVVSGFGRTLVIRAA